MKTKKIILLELLGFILIMSVIMIYWKVSVVPYEDLHITASNCSDGNFYLFHYVSDNLEFYIKNSTSNITYGSLPESNHACTFLYLNGSNYERNK